ncbi:MAG: hypothetical protein AM325_008245 [Candidatus Thorarchaeota archaeon SMTZ1-45]|nr:MAG: hypothetical protein AM325_09965 [Candidatus Thorarchaeota archaeon SMTZ1-45]
MRWPNAKIVAAQFLFYVIGGVGAFLAWVMIQAGYETLLYDIAGNYLSYHFQQWTSRLFFWGPIVLISAGLALVAVFLILRANKIGGYLGIVSFLIGFTVDILVANIMFVHVLVGVLIGWVLLAPLLFGWDDIFNPEDQ